MRNSKILAKIRAGKAAKLAMMGHFMPPFVAYAAHFGYDGIWLDLEHRPLDAREIQALLAFFHLYDIDCLIRPATREKAPLYRYYEDGAAGLVVPHVSTPDEARDLVRKVKFPPVGDRGIEGNGLETNFGLDIAMYRSELTEHALRETFLLVQIETPEGLANVDEIASVPGVDGLYIGPGDMGVRMRLLPESERVSTDELMRRVAEACRKHEKAWGYFAATADDLPKQVELGAQLVLWGFDLRLLKDAFTQASRELDEALKT
jgi:2-keto-3-deoxy-L-rhamnonate aldolase RhmA